MKKAGERGRVPGRSRSVDQRGRFPGTERRPDGRRPSRATRHSKAEKISNTSASAIRRRPSTAAIPPAKKSIGPPGKNVPKKSNKGTKPDNKGKPGASKLANAKRKLPSSSRFMIHPSTDEVALTRTPRRGWRSWCGGDFLVIMSFWTFELFYVLVEAIKYKTLDLENGRLYANNGLELTDYLVDIAVTSVATLILGVALNSVQLKFWVVYVGLALYTTTAVLGYTRVLGLLNDTVWISAFLDGMQFFWHIVNPIRFFVIFHQKWPIDVKQTKIIVSINVFFIGATRYFSTVLIKQYDLSKASLQIAWLFVMIGMLCWMMIILSSHPFVKEDPVNFEAIRAIYSFTKAYLSFDNRQNSTILFFLLISPRVIFFVMARLITLSLSTDKNSYLFIYRVDMVVAAITMVSTLIIVHFLTKIREEMKDLYVILIAHALNLFCLILLLLVATSIEDKHKYGISERQGVKKVPRWSGLYIIYQEDWIGRIIVELVGQETQRPDNIRALFWVELIDEKQYEIVGKLENGKELTTIFRGKVVLIPNKSVVYYVHNVDSPLIKFEGIDNIKYEKKRRKVILVNTISSCELPKKGWDLGDGVCQTIDILYSEWAQKDDVDPIAEKSFTPPASYAKLLVWRINGERFSIKTKSPDGPTVVVPVTSLDEGNILLVLTSRGKASYVCFDIVMKPPRLLRLTTPKAQVTTKTPSMERKVEQSKLLTAVTVLYGGAFGSAQAAYIHFIWIRAPFKMRTFVFAGCWTWFFVVQCCCDLFMNNFTIELTTIVLIVQAVCVIWHLVSMYLYKSRLPPLGNYEVENRQF